MPPESKPVAQPGSEIVLRLHHEGVWRRITSQNGHLTSERIIRCTQCNEPVERNRRCYAIPVCYACLPPPEPLGICPLSSGIPALDALLGNGIPGVSTNRR